MKIDFFLIFVINKRYSELNSKIKDGNIYQIIIFKFQIIEI
jgi:hypothetical protein